MNIINIKYIYMNSSKERRFLMLKYTKPLLIMLAAASLAGCNKLEATSQKTEKGSSNNLISYYETIKLEKDIESSFNKEVFKKKGYPDGYDFTLSRAKKEVVLVIRPYSKKNFNYLKNDLQNNMEEELKRNN